MTVRLPNLFAVALLALGIGLATSVYSLVHGVLLRSLPYPDAERLAYVWTPNPHLESAPKELGPANATYYEWRRQARSFAELAMWQEGSMRLADQSKIGVVQVSGNFFATIGTAPVAGRTLMPEEDEPGRDDAAVVSHRFWTERMGGGTDLAGKTLRLNGRAFRIVGVMPRGFAFPQPWELPAAIRGHEAFDVWIPLAHTARDRADEGSFGLGNGSVIGRLQPGVSREEAQAEMAGLMTRIGKTRQGLAKDATALTGLLLDSAFGDVRLEMLLLLGAVGLVLLLTCANVSNLLLLQFAVREREMQIRTALGATRGHLVRMLIGETMRLSVAGGGLGLALAYGAVRLLARLAPPELPRIETITLDAPVLLFALGVSLATGVLCGLAAALPASNTSLLQVRGTVAHGRLRDRLVACQVALSLTLVAGAGLLVRSYLHVAAEPTGYGMEAVTVPVNLPEGYDGRRQASTFRRILEAVAGRPEVAAAAAINYLPLAGGGSVGSLAEIEGYRQTGKGLSTHQRAVSPGYFQTMGIPMINGREFAEADYGSKATAVIVSEGFARQYFGGAGSAVGKRIRQATGGEWQQIIGVARDVKSTNLEQAPLGEIYRMLDKEPQQSLYLAVRPRRSGYASGLAATIRAAVASSEPGATLEAFRTMRERVWEAGAGRRFHTSIVSSFASLSLVLGLAGLFGLAMHWVRTRRQEIGVRMALGATAGGIVRLVLTQGLRPLAWGTAAGILASWWVSRLMGGLLYGVPAKDPIVFAAAPAILVVGGLLAYLGPCWSATRVDPAVALRNE